MPLLWVKKKFWFYSRTNDFGLFLLYKPNTIIAPPFYFSFMLLFLRENDEEGNLFSRVFLLEIASFFSMQGCLVLPLKEQMAESDCDGYGSLEEFQNFPAH